MQEVTFLGVALASCDVFPACNCHENRHVSFVSYPATVIKGVFEIVHGDNLLLSIKLSHQ